MPPPRHGGQGNVRQMDDTGGPQAWFESLPVITRYWFGGALAVTVMCNFGFLPIMKMVWTWDRVWENFEIWRFLTPFLFVGKFDFNTLMALYMLQSYSNRYEMEPYNTGGGGGTADYAFALMFGAISIVVTYPIMGMLLPAPPVFARTLMMFVLYVWSKRHPTAPTMYQKDVLHTPQFLIDQIGIGAYVPPANNTAAGNNVWSPPGRVNPPSDAAGPSRGHSWGSSGQRLGSG
eukprot:scaffold11726_cov125-Skeletonema_marinoi.AAC.1